MAASSVILESPVGPLRLFAEDGAIVGLYTEAQPDSLALGASGTPDSVLRVASEQLAAWFEGRLRTFALPLRPKGTAFQQEVWRELQRIPFGETRTYGEIAAVLGQPTASRAVGAANGRNPISIIVPCHRVIGATGALTGYAGGLARKRWLLDHERAVLAR